MRRHSNRAFRRHAIARTSINAGVAAAAAALAGLFGCSAQPAGEGTSQSPSLRFCTAARASPELERTISGLYEAISFPAGTRPTIGELKAHFVAEGVLADLNGAGRTSGVDDFIDGFLALHRSGAISALHEREAHQVTCVYGRVAHRFSFYEARFAKSDPTPFAVGVNSIQLAQFGDEWKVTSWAWNDDADGRGYFNSLFEASAQ